MLRYITRYIVNVNVMLLYNCVLLPRVPLLAFDLYSGHTMAIFKSFGNSSRSLI